MSGRSVPHTISNASRVAGTLLGTAMVLSLVGCSSSDDGEIQRIADDLIAETDGALDEATATCVAEGLHDSYGDESYRGVLDAAGRPSEDVSGAVADVRSDVIDVFASCDALDPIIDQGR